MVLKRKNDEAEDSDSDAEIEKFLREEEGFSEEEDDEDEEDDENDADDDDEFDESLTKFNTNSDVTSVESFDLKDGEVLSKFADGTNRIIRPEIDAVYDSDDSDKEEKNTIGNIPLSLYDEMPHIGYDINGKRIMRPAKGSALDALLEQIELPEGWTGLLDKNSGSSLNLSQEELELIKKIQKNEKVDDDYNPYEPTIEWFTSKTEIMPLTAVPEPKRRFVPSKHEAKRIMKIVRAIREGRIVPKKDSDKDKDSDSELERDNYDLWEDDNDVQDHIMTLRAPNLPPPTNAESYNPPAEYLLTDKEKEEWEKSDPMDRERNFVPQKYDSLRKVPGYQESIREVFERSLDLYLAPRVRHNKLNIDPESLVPDLPSPKDLKPFPIKCSVVYKGHSGKIRTVSLDPSGNWLATGSDDGWLIVWEVISGRAIWKTKLVDPEEDDDEKIESMEWNPNPDLGLLAVLVGEKVYFVVPPVFGFDIENASCLKVEQGFGNESNNNKDKETSAAQWNKATEKQLKKGILLSVHCRKTLKKVSWHHKGDYFVTVSPSSGNVSILIHQLSKHVSQSPFKKSKGILMDAKFHPFKPQLFVASQRYIKIYDLSRQVMIKKLLPGARWINSFDIHKGGDNVIVSSFDKKVLWHDLELSSTPYKILRYHEKAVRSIKFHKGNLPLWASSSDDGSIHVFHGMVYDDLMSNPLLVPLKKLTGHKTVNNLGVLDLIWHPKEAWLVSCGADGTARLWTT